MRRIRVAVIGAGPAGIYAADILANEYGHAKIDVFDQLPAPYGLVRYGVAPDHPRIKEIVKALRKVLSRPEIRFFGNVRYGSDIKLPELRSLYDAVIFATGASSDRPLDIPGIELPGSFGAADFVSWYDGHPDVPRDWPLTATHVAVLGAGNVALDVARILAKPADEQLSTEIAPNVYRGLALNQATDVHLFARRGPAQTKFTPMEFRELSHSPNVDVVVDPEGFDVDDETSQQAIKTTRSTRLVVDTMLRYLESDLTDAPRRIHLHLCQAPVAVLGTDRVEGLRTERTELVDGRARGTGEYRDWPVQAVYRAVGYLSTHLADLPFDHDMGVVPHDAGRVLDMDGTQLEGCYVTGWIKRGPIGLIGHTKSDAAETVSSLLADLPGLRTPEYSAPDAILNHLREAGVDYTTWAEWEKLDEHEIALGRGQARERVKVVARDAMIRAGRGSDDSVG